MRYAMVLKNRVIGIEKDQESTPKWPPDNKGNKIIAVECDDTIEIGMIYNPETSEFSRYVPIPYTPTAAEKVLAIVSKSKEEIENAAIDAYTEELIEGGLL